MRQKDKKKIIICAAAVVVLLLFAAGQYGNRSAVGEGAEDARKEETGSGGEAEGDVTKLVVAYPTSAVYFPEDLAMVEEAVKEIVMEKLNIEVEFRTDLLNYEEVINSMLAGQQQLDIMFAYNDGLMEMLMDGQLCELDELLETYGQGIIEAVGRDVIDTCRCQGKLYGIPNNRDYAVGWDGYILRKDILDKYQIRKEDITSVEKLEEVFAIVRENEPEMTIVDCDGYTMLSNQYFVDCVNNMPFGVHMDYGRETELSNVFKTQEYREALERIYRWNQLGYVEKNPLEEKASTDYQIYTGELFAYACRGKPGIERQEKLSTGRDVVFVQFGENAVIGNAMAAMPWVITQNTVSPEKSMQLLNLFYTDAEIMNLLSYGIEGVHYVKKEDGHIASPEGRSINPFIGEAWHMPNQFITYVWEGNPLTLWEDVKRFNEESLRGCDYGFNFDISSVSTEYLELKHIYEKYRPILENGLVEPEEGLEQMNKELDANFIEEVIAEKQKQFDEFRSSRQE